MSKYLRVSPPIENQNLAWKYIKSSRCDLKIFSYEIIFANNHEFSVRCLEYLNSLADDYNKLYKILMIKFFIKDYESVDKIIQRLFLVDIPSPAFCNDSYFRPIFLIAEELNDAYLYRLAYVALTANIGLNCKDYFLMTRSHAYICKAARKSPDKNLDTFNGISIDSNYLAELSSAKDSSIDSLNVVGIIRLRNESNILESCLRCFFNFVDSVVVYDDCSDDNSVDIIRSFQQKNPEKSIKIIGNKSWKFNEAVAHSALFSEARKLQATHIFQIDCDEILSGIWLKNMIAFKKCLSKMEPGDVLALPWIDLFDEKTRINRSKAQTQLPIFRGTMYKDCIYCDDGLTTYDPSDLIHVNIVPRIYKKRYIVADEDYSLLHLEFFNLTNIAIKKDWYKIFEYINNGKDFSAKSYNISAEIASLQNALEAYNPNLEFYESLDLEPYKRLNTWRICYNLKAYQCGLVTSKQFKSLAIDYKLLVSENNFPGLDSLIEDTILHIDSCSAFSN